MFRKYELIGAGISVGFMALALYLVQVNTTPQIASTSSNQAAQVVDSQQELAQTISNAVSNNGEVMELVKDDVKIGSGDEVKEGDVVRVHYVGTLQNGQEFDNSRKRGQAFQFTVGAGQVISGWDEGVLGMKVGGQRVLVIPPDMAYGENGIGPIPGNATLLFAIELLEIK